MPCSPAPRSGPFSVHGGDTAAFGCSPRSTPRLIAADPKLLMGYSDITALLWGLHVRTGLVSVHGPVVRQLAGDEGETFAALLSQWIQEPGRAPEIDLSSSGYVLQAGRASGPVFGGNLTLVTHLVGTGFMPDLTGAVLFLEETNEPLYRIDRMLTHLALTGVFDRIAGFLAGDFTGTDDRSEAVQDLLMERLAPFEMPVVWGLGAGHGERNLPLPIGLHATLDTGRMRLSYHEPCFADGR